MSFLNKKHNKGENFDDLMSIKSICENKHIITGQVQQGNQINSPEIKGTFEIQHAEITFLKK